MSVRSGILKFSGDDGHVLRAELHGGVWRGDMADTLNACVPPDPDPHPAKGDPRGNQLFAAVEALRRAGWRAAAQTTYEPAPPGAVF